MYVGLSVFLIAVGAIMRFAVADQFEGIDLATAGLIVMIAGVIALIASLFQMVLWRDRAAAADRVDRRPYV